jgi:hypothetical protein
LFENILEKVTNSLSKIDTIEGIVLGGSRARGTHSEDSDIDIGIYYSEPLDVRLLNEIAAGFDDEGRENLIGPVGSWGKWVNTGGWLTINEFQVDWIFRDLNRVKEIIEQSEKGIFTTNYHAGHPHAFISSMYRGELAISRLLYARTDAFTKLKNWAEDYPPALKNAIIEYFSFEAGFSLLFAKKYVKKPDIYYVAGHLFRLVSSLNQVIFALNEEYCLNEKKAIIMIEKFKVKPKDYSKRVNSIFENLGESIEQSIKSAEDLVNQVQEVCDAEGF